MDYIIQLFFPLCSPCLSGKPNFELREQFYQHLLAVVTIPGCSTRFQIVFEMRMLLYRCTVLYLKEPSEQLHVEDIFKRETRYTGFLEELKQSITEALPVTEKENLAEDIFSIKLQTTAYNFYTSIWHSLSREEKFILYDLAEDDLVNTKDVFNVNMLINKGLIVRYDGLLHIFNKSFRNFILTGIGDAETQKNQKTNKRKQHVE